MPGDAASGLHDLAHRKALAITEVVDHAGALIEGLEAIPWVQFEKKTSGTAFRAASVVPAAAVKAA